LGALVNTVQGAVMCYFFHSPVTLIGVRSHETSFVLDSIVFLVLAFSYLCEVRCAGAQLLGHGRWEDPVVEIAGGMWDRLREFGVGERPPVDVLAELAVLAVCQLAAQSSCFNIVAA